jgi:hypothetical protein
MKAEPEGGDGIPGVCRLASNLEPAVAEGVLEVEPNAKRIGWLSNAALSTKAATARNHGLHWTAPAR